MRRARCFPCIYRWAFGAKNHVSTTRKIDCKNQDHTFDFLPITMSMSGRPQLTILTKNTFHCWEDDVLDPATKKVSTRLAGNCSKIAAVVVLFIIGTFGSQCIIVN